MITLVMITFSKFRRYIIKKLDNKYDDEQIYEKIRIYLIKFQLQYFM